MSADLRCQSAIDPDTLHRYVAGTLSAAEEDAFEIHLLSCRACQAEVRTGMALAAALRERGAAPRSSMLRRRVVWLAAPLAAAALLLLVIRPGESALRKLGAIGEFPTFEALPVRSDAPAAQRRADEGMAAYAAGEYRRAAELLAQSAALDAAPATSFFLGVSLLALGDEERATESLQAVVQHRGNVYVSEAHYFLAKAWLRRGQADSALVHLSTLGTATTLLGIRARALADSIRTIVR